MRAGGSRGTLTAQAGSEDGVPTLDSIGAAFGQTFSHRPVSGSRRRSID